MAYLSEQTLFDYFEEQNTTLDIHALNDRYESVSQDNIISTAHGLVNRGLLVEKEAFTWELSHKAKQMILENAQKAKEEKAWKQLEKEKLQLDLELNKRVLKDYPITRRQAKLAIILSIVSILVQVILQVIQSIKQ